MPFADNSTAPNATSGLAKTVLLTATVLWCVYWSVHAWPYWEDDAYIHLEFARSFAAGQGFAFNGHVVAGDTAPFWVFLIAGMHAFIRDWLVAGKVLTIFGAVLGFAGTYAFARRLATSVAAFPGASVFPAAMVFLVALNPYTCYWIFSGMEPLAAAGLACFAVLAATAEVPSSRTFLVGCVLAGIGPLFRPEMTFLAALLALPLLAQWSKLPGSASAKFKSLMAGAIFLTAPLALWSLYSLHAFGHLLPNTNAAKRAAPGDSVVHHMLTSYSLGFPLILCGLVAGILYTILRTGSVRKSLRSAMASVFRTGSQENAGSLPLAGWIFIAWASINTIFYIANHTYVQTRYILVTAPALTIVVMAAAFMASRRIGRAAYVLALITAAAVSIVVVRPFVRNKGIDCALVKNIALCVRDRIPPDAPVAVFGIGEVAFFSQHPVVDTGGITRPGAIPYLNAPPEQMLRWAQSEGAQYFIGGQPQPNAELVCSIDMLFVGWSLHPSDYNTTNQFGLWKLVPEPGSIHPADPPTPAQSGH